MQQPDKLQNAPIQTNGKNNIGKVGGGGVIVDDLSLHIFIRHKEPNKYITIHTHTHTYISYTPK